MTHVDDLADALAVSPSTVRRDLGRLSEGRKVARTYGGAVVPETFHERPIAESAQAQRRAKEAIAKAARQFVPTAGTIFIDAGTTCVALARLLGREATEAGLVVATRGLETALALADSEHIDVILLGGRVRSLSHGLVGPLTDLATERLSFTAAFLGADAVDPSRGVGEPTLEEIAVKERVAARTQHVVVVADATKLAVPDVPAWTSFTGGWTLVTDAAAPTDLSERCATAGVGLTVAS
ncbi:MAG: DeoR family transcriptional regulator [Actinophytocola sp.]|nr:DeoR family transcriptional regulator [Actinophytocola sp.]